MKILLREHVEHLGDRGQTVSVAAGYARNYLLPKGLALLATPGNLKVLAQQRRMWEVKEGREVEAAQAIAARIAGVHLSVTRRAGRGGTLYGSVTSMEIAELLAREGLQVDRRRIVLAEPIKSVGLHEIQIKLHRQVTGRIQINVEGEGGQATEAVEGPDDPDASGRDD